jgi:hypothetical protein
VLYTILQRPTMRTSSGSIFIPINWALEIHNVSCSTHAHIMGQNPCQKTRF